MTTEAEEPMMLVGGVEMSLSEYERLVSPGLQVAVHTAPASPGSGPVLGANGLTVMPSVADPGHLSDDERQIVWAYRANKAAT